MCLSGGREQRRTLVVPTPLDNGRRSPKKLLRAVVARLLGRKAYGLPGLVFKKKSAGA